MNLIHLMRTDFVEVIDDFLTQSYYESLRASVTDPGFPWYFQDNVTYESSEIEGVYINENPINNSFGFSHVIYFNSEVRSQVGNLFMPFAFQVKDYLKASEIMRVRLDMTVYNPDTRMHGPHVDYNDIPHYSAVYYINDSDGPTVLFNEKQGQDSLTIKETIDPKPNRLLLFDGSYIHTGYSPSRHNSRVLINSNYIP